MEQGLAAALLAASLSALLPLLEADAARGRRWFAVGVPLGLLCATRPDAPLFVVGIVAAVLSTQPGPLALTLRRVAGTDVTIEGLDSTRFLISSTDRATMVSE